MTENLEAQYNLVVGILASYSEFAAAVVRRVKLRVALFGTGSSAGDALAQQWLQKHLTFQAPTSPDMKRLIRKHAREEDRGNPFFDIVVSDYPLEELARYVGTHCPEVDFDQVARLFDMRCKRPWWTSLKVLVSGVLGVALFFLNTVPDGFVRRFGGNVETYDTAVFLVTVSLVWLVVLFWLFYWLLLGRHRSMMIRKVGEALGYLAIRGPVPVSTGANADEEL
jgi:hypothetical protein